MAFVIADRVRETSTTTGTGNFTLAGAVTGYQTFDAALDTGDTTYYAIAEQGGVNWEVGIGTFTSPSTLARTTILSSSNGGSVVTFGAGTKDVFISLPSSKTNVEDQPNLIEVNSSSAALRITQTGTGNALLVEDSANPDSSPFVVDASGNVGIGTTTPTALLDVNGSVAITGTARRITGDFSNATQTNRIFFQTTTSGGGTSVGAIPNATGGNSAFNAFGSPDPANSSFAQLRAGADTSDVRLTSGITGTGTYYPFTFYTGGSERMRIDTSGNVGIGTSSPGSKLDVKGTLRLSGSTSGYVGLAPAAAAGSTTYTLPAADGTSGQVLSTNGSGTLSWASAGGGKALNTQTFNSSGTWTKPSGYGASARAWLQVWAGGGSGGRSTPGAGLGGGGGGGGGYSEKWVDLSALGSTETITIGAGGAAVGGNPQNGNTGGNSSIGSVLTAYGGGGGVGTGAGGARGLPFPTSSGIGSQSSGSFDSGGGGAQVCGVGAAGQSSFWGAGGGGGGGTVSGGAGGQSVNGGAGGAGSTGTGTAGSAPGGGGGGGRSGNSGAGAAGRVIITVFDGA